MQVEISNSSIEYREYTVKVKDYEQNITHRVHEWAKSQNEANAKALEELRVLLGYDNLAIV